METQADLQEQISSLTEVLEQKEKDLLTAGLTDFEAAMSEMKAAMANKQREANE